MFHLSAYVQRYPPFLQVDNQGKLYGVCKDFFTATFRYFAKYNTTFCTSQAKVHSNQEVDYMIQTLQNQKVDVNIFLTSLPELYENITNGPTVDELSCHISSRPIDLRVETDYDFMSVIDFVDSETIIMLMIIYVCVIFLMKLIAQSSFMEQLWTLISVILKSGVKMASKWRCLLLLSLIVFSFLFETIFFGFLKTDLAAASSKRKIETIQDMIKYKVNPCAIAYSRCANLLSTIGNKQIDDIVARAMFTNLMIPGVNKFMKSLYGGDNYVFIGSKAEHGQINRYSCIARKDLVHKSGALIRASKPFDERRIPIFLNKYLHPELRDKLIRTFYNSYQMKLDSRSRLNYLILTKMYGAFPPTSCMQLFDRSLNSAAFKAISLDFFRKSFIILTSLITLALIVFTVEIHFTHFRSKIYTIKEINMITWFKMMIKK